MVCLDSTRIPRTLLFSAYDIAQVKAVGILKAHCLINDQHSGCFNVHSLVYLDIRNWLKSQSLFETLSRKALRQLADKFPCADSEDLLTVCDSYIAHAEVVLRDNDEDEITGTKADESETAENVKRSRLAYQCSQYFQVRGAYVEAERMARDALKWNKGDDAKERTLRSNLATAVRYQGCFESARAIDEALLTERTKVFGEDNEESLSSLNNLGLSLQGLGRYHEAEMMHRRALVTRKRMLGRENAETLSSMNNLAMCLQ